MNDLPSAQPKLEKNTHSERVESDKLGVKSGKTCIDTISRQEAIDAMNALHDKPNAWLDCAVDAVMALPTEQPDIDEFLRNKSPKEHREILQWGNCL